MINPSTLFAKLAAGALMLAAVVSCSKDADQAALEARRVALPEFEEAVFSKLAGITDPQESRYMTFLYAWMPVPDMASKDVDYYLANTRSALEVREKMGWNIPEREFRHFVLPVRVNNENLDDFRTIYAEELCERVKGMSLYDAALEINHWCHEKATYHPSDGRTSSPLATISTGWGRCGEESVLGVAALRAAGIPARQVYTPRWAHTDDNHAWVEVWVDGTWHFLGACEPEPKLDMAWFNDPVSRAMLLHTKVYGNYVGDEDVIERNDVYTEINVIRNYVNARKLVVTVKDCDGAPVKDADVEFRIYNYAEFYRVASYKSDADGHSSLDIGMGDMLVWARKDGRFGFAKALASESAVEVVLDHNVGEAFSADIDIVPPPSNPLKSSATEEEIKANTERFNRENEMRDAAHVFPADGCPQAYGNWKTIVTFRENAAAAGLSENADKVLAGLSIKDFRDVSLEALMDALPFGVSPRVELERLEPYFQVIGEGLDFNEPSQVKDWIAENIRIVEGLNPNNLRMAPSDVWKFRVADPRSRDIFYVALCRRFGMTADYDAVNSRPAGDDLRAAGSLRVSYTPSQHNPDPEYYRHFSLSAMDDGSPSLLSYEDSDEGGVPPRWSNLLDPSLKLSTGSYLLVTGTRNADGSVLAHLEFFNIDEEAVTEIPFIMRSSDEGISVIGNMDPEHSVNLESGSSTLLAAGGRGYWLIAVTGYKDEPTTHAVRQMTAISDVLNSWGRPVFVLGKAQPSGLENMIRGNDDDKAVLAMLTSGCKSESLQLPVIALCDSFGRIVYFSQGYNTSLGEELKKVTSRL
ncbi:MAG: transglutaminase domain-containing protein [Bacteroidales bacterium]|nr:transglutaminase domain-containing protein [Bacteroidales bacterium]